MKIINATRVYSCKKIRFNEERWKIERLMLRYGILIQFSPRWSCLLRAMVFRVG